ncbi:MAG: hypothetical protein U0175_26775 [Caldilineaceae bacterium]
MSAKVRYVACMMARAPSLYQPASKLPLAQVMAEPVPGQRDRSTVLAAIHPFRSAWLALIASLMLITLLSLSSPGNASAGIPLPINLPIPDTVFHTDNYGNSMALDGNILVVGAPWSKVNNQEQQGLAYIFVRNGSSATDFTLLKSITGSDSSDHESFGWAVDVHGDTIAVGAYGADLSGGAVYLFERNQGGANNWGEVKKLVRGDNRTLTYFGRSLAMHGDTIAVGAALGLGEVLLYQRNAGGANQWGKTQTINASYTVTPSIRVAGFGESIAFDGNQLVVSAPKESVRAEDLPAGSPAPPSNFSGAVYIFRQENGQWLREAKLFTGDLDLTTHYFGNGYGSSLALNGDLLFVGETSGTTNEVSAGKVFVYQRGGGIPSVYGQPGPWGEVAELSPDDGVANDRFSWGLYAVDDGIFVSAEKQGFGKVYFFRNPATMLLSRQALPRSALAWTPVYSFTTTSVSSSRFGFPLIGSGDSVVIGDQAANGGRGNLAAYSKSALFAADPNATLGPTPTVSPSPTPTATPPVSSASCTGSEQRIYLPLVSRQLTGSDTHAIVAQVVATPFVSSLSPGCVITSPTGIKVGAVAGAISETLTLSLTITSAPAITLPTGSVVRSDYVQLVANRNQLAAIESPFVVAVPVPDGADPNHLVLLHTLVGSSVLDGEIEDEDWGYLPGAYDAASKLFLARLPYLSRSGTTLVLINHADFDTTLNSAQSTLTLQAANTNQTTTQFFNAWCLTETFANPSDCTNTQEAIVANMVTEIYLRMTSFFDYPGTIRLQDTTGQFIVSESASINQQRSDYAVYIISKSDRRCRNAVGFYSPESGMLALCWRPGEVIDQGEKDTLIHELFHAFEFTNRTAMRHREAGIQQDWIIEGMAAASEKSYPESTMKRTPYFGVDNLQKVDKALTAGKAGDKNVEEYLAQDFWVYVGASQNLGLEYLNHILRIGGAHQDDVDLALNFFYGKSLSTFYWEWVKHQSIENTYDVGEGSGELCKLSETALQSGQPVKFPISEQFYPFETADVYDRLPPLTAKVIEIDFGSRSAALVTTEYEGCAGIQDQVAKEVCNTVAGKKLKVKIYVEDEPSCANAALPGVINEGTRQLTNITDTKRYFIVVANVDAEESPGYFVAIE